MDHTSAENELIQLQPAGADATAANGAPTREPEVWDERIRDFNPLLAHAPEPEPLAVSPAFAAAHADFNVEQYLAAEHRKDLLRFSTAGSVDDGKSTLIGRLLYDTQSVYDDQVRSIEGKGTTAPGVLDLALLTDGLRAEREQGITIDVAYRYFSTGRRKFIIADTPGHEQYTRNMATGASTASLAIVLVDARKGVLIQSRRHATITALLGVPHVVVAVNKMDLVAYAHSTFDAIVRDFTAFFDQLGELRPRHLYFVPVSALAGDNVVNGTTHMPWYTGPTLLELLETVPAVETDASQPLRMAVQRVLRPNLDFRGFAGQLAAGTVHPGDEIMVLPSGRTSRVARIVTFDGDLASASAPRSVTLTLDDELDISRGDMIVAPASPPQLATRFRASLVWMNEVALEPGRRLRLKHTSRSAPASIARVESRLDVADVRYGGAATLTLNEIGVVEISSSQPLALDRYADNRTTGSFILIDPQTNATVAAGMVREVLSDSENEPATGPVTAGERLARWGHRGAVLTLSGPPEFIDAAERTLLVAGTFALRLPSETQAHVATAIANAGALALLSKPAETASLTYEAELHPLTAATDLLPLLTRLGVLVLDGAYATHKETQR